MREGRLRPYRAIDVCRQVASALDAAHAMGLIHRDVKPANVLIEGRTAFLTDFGLTKRLEGTHAQITRVGDVVGTIHYVAPEQIEGRKVSARSDVYSLGCLLYHCLSGQVPFARETDVAVIYAHLSEEPTKLVDVRPDLPEGLDAVVAKAMDKSPDRRFPSCGDMISAARAVLDAAGPLGDTTPPRHSTGLGAAIAAPTPRSATPPPPRAGRACCSAGSTTTRARSRAWRSAATSTCSRRRADATVERAREERPDLVIVDWAGRAGGIADLRADAITRDAKVLLLVDYGQSERREVAAVGRRRAARRAVLAAAAAGQAPAAARRRGHRRVTALAAVLAGGRGRRMGGRRRSPSWPASR